MINLKRILLLGNKSVYNKGIFSINKCFIHNMSDFNFNIEHDNKRSKSIYI